MSPKVRFIQFCDNVVLDHPKAWIYSFTLLGMVYGLAINGSLGAAIGLAFHRPDVGAELGMAAYAMWISTKVEAIKAHANELIETLEASARLR